MPCLAYPASKPLQDCSCHESVQDCKEVQRRIKEEIKDGETVIFLNRFAKGGTYIVFDPTCERGNVPHVWGMANELGTCKVLSKGGEELATPAAWGWPQQLVVHLLL